MIETNANDQTVKTGRVSTPDGMFKVAVRVFGKVRDAGSTDTTSNLLDPFQAHYQRNDVLQPPYELASLALFPEISSSLSQCIDVMITNVDGFGWELVPHGVFQTKTKKDKPLGAEAEKDRLSLLFNYPNAEVGQGFTQLRRLLRKDYEGMGIAGMEVVRTAIAEICELHWSPAYAMRLTPKDPYFTRFTQKVRDENGNYSEVVRHKRFRRIVQITDANRKVWFKEFGDPRVISSETGEVLRQSGHAKGAATEIIWIAQDSNYSPYGVPRWIPNMMGILGARKAESVNYSFFDHKTIPPLVITVSGGQLVPETVQILKDTFEHSIKGLKNYHRALVLEAEPADIGEVPGEKAANVQIKVQPLTQFIQNDAQFLKYRDEIDTAIAASFRFSPMFRGKTRGEFTRATVFESVRAGEQQVFIPERRKFDNVINNTILADMGIKYWDYRTKGATTTDYPTILKSIASVKEAMPVGVIHELVAEMRSLPIADISDELYDTLLIDLQRRSQSLVGPDGKEPEKPGDDKTKQQGVKKFVHELIEVRKELQKQVDNEAV